MLEEGIISPVRTRILQFKIRHSGSVGVLRFLFRVEGSGFRVSGLGFRD